MKEPSPAEDPHGAQARVRAVHETLKAARAPRPRATVITDETLAEHGRPWVTEIVARAGGTDIGGLRAPDVVLVAPDGCDLALALAAARRIADHPVWQLHHAADLWALDARRLLPPDGAPHADAIETIARIFNPALFPPPDPRLAVRVRAIVRPA